MDRSHLKSELVAGLTALDNVIIRSVIVCTIITGV